MIKRRFIFIVSLAAAVLMAQGCGSGDGGPGTGADTGSAPGETGSVAASFSLTSASIDSGGAISKKYACESEGGSDISPQLGWTGPPAGVAAYAVIMDDETPPCGKGASACMHWSVFNIPADKTGLAEGEDMSAIGGVALGRNYTGANGYAGPCPPSPHVYKITVYALSGDAPVIKAGEAYTRAGFEAAFARSIIGSDTIEGTYSP